MDGRCRKSRAVRVALTVSALGALTPIANADVESARLIQKGATAFECSIFTAFVGPGRDEDSKRLFQIGYDSTIAFLNALHADRITEEEFRTFVPLDVALNLKQMGRTDPAFQVGRVYQDKRKFAADRILYGRTASGAIDYERDATEAQTTAEAKRLYDQARCALID